MEQSLLQGDNQQVRLLFNISWLVGLFEGEGCVGICNNYSNNYRVHTPRISITNSDPKIINACVHILKSLNLAFHIGKKTRQKEQRVCWNVTIMGHKRVKRFLELVIPFMLGEKKKQAEIILEFTNSRINNISNSNKKAYIEKELEMLEELKRIKSNNLNDHTSTFPFGEMKIWSELNRNIKRLAEMANPIPPEIKLIKEYYKRVDEEWAKVPLFNKLGAFCGNK